MGVSQSRTSATVTSSGDSKTDEVALGATSGDRPKTPSSPERPSSLNASNSPSPNRVEITAIRIPESKDFSDSDPRSPTTELARTPLVDSAPFVDPRSPANDILRTPLDKTSGFKAFNLEDSLPFIDESLELARPPPSDALQDEGGGSSVGSDRVDDAVDPPSAIVKEFDAAIIDELEGINDEDDEVGGAAVGGAVVAHASVNEQWRDGFSSSCR